jgi:hypothetical protein
MTIGIGVWDFVDPIMDSERDLFTNWTTTMPAIRSIKTTGNQNLHPYCLFSVDMCPLTASSFP